MKIGILTFHSQLNYGGVLQCWALQTALEEMGHEVVVVDRWLDADRESLVGAYNLKQWIKFVVRVVLGLGDYGLYRRRAKTERFLNKYINLTPYHFYKWDEAPADLGVDLLVIGSDQVWRIEDICLTFAACNHPNQLSSYIHPKTNAYETKTLHPTLPSGRHAAGPTVSGPR